MKTENKICFYLNFTRDVTMYSNIFLKIDPNKICFIFNDLYKEKNNNNKNEFKRIVILFKKKFPKYHNFHKLSQVLKSGLKFRVLISAGDLPTSEITLTSITKFIIKKILLKKNAEIYEKKFVEKDISNFSIKFPNNLDRNIRDFPHKSLISIFNIFFTTLKVEMKLIRKKFGNRKIYPIGFPKLDNHIKRKILKKKIVKEFKLKPKKKIIFYLPTLSSAQNKDLIIKIILDLKKLESNYNVVVRPHPKDKDNSQIKYNLFKKSNLNLDLVDGRDTSDLINVADYIITDGGSTVLETIYLRKKILIHNWKVQIDQEKLENRLTDEMRLDNILASKLIKFKNFDNILNLMRKADNHKYLKKINFLADQIFFKKNKSNIVKIIKSYLVN